MNIRRESRLREQLGPGQGPVADDYENEAEPFAFSRIVRLFLDNWLPLVATTGLGLVLAAWQVQSETPLYTSSAEVVLESNDENVVNIESVVPQRALNYITVNTELRVFNSEELMQRAVEALSLEEDPEFNPSLREPPEWKTAIGYDDLLTAIGFPPEPQPAAPTAEEARETAASILRSKVSVSNLQNTLVFVVSVETEEPRKSAEIANTVAELYVAGQRETKYKALDDAMGWLGNRVVELKAELETAEAEIEDFSASATLVSEETLVANTERLKSMRARRAELVDAAAALRQRVERLAALRAEQDFTALAEAIPDPQARAAARELAARHAASATAPAPSDDPALTRFDARFGRWLDNLRVDAERAESQVAAAGRSVADLERQVDSQSADLVKLRQMQREAQATRLIYESFLGRLKEISVQQGIQRSDSRILSRASFGYRSHPRVQQALYKGGVLGLVFGFMLVAVRNVLRSAIRTPEELESVSGLTVIGVIPDDRTRRPDKLIQRLIDKPASGLAESVRNLRSAIQLSNIDATPRVIVVTSSVPDEGKSILAAALAQTSATPGKKVLLVDADLRRRILRAYFQIEAEAGLISLLTGRSSFEDVVQHDPQTGLDILIADDEKVTPVDFFGSQQFANFIAEARKSYDLIILDTPPVLAVPETRVIAQHADAVVYSVRWNSTTRRMLQTGLELLRQVHVRVTGLALTRIDPRRMDRFGYYGYGSSSRSGKLGRYYAN